MKRSTNTAPVSLSTSYLMGSPCIGISMTTLQSLGMSRPAETRSRLMCGVATKGRRLYAADLWRLGESSDDRRRDDTRDGLACRAGSWRTDVAERCAPRAHCTPD